MAGHINKVSQMQTFVVGSGKLASELLSPHTLGDTYQVKAWSEKGQIDVKSIVVHAGSGRELAAVAAFCRKTASPLIELSTGSDIETAVHDFPVVLCPNTNILMLKFMSMLETSGHLFRGYKISLVESHQATKTSVPGTAANLARAIGLMIGDIRSVRDPSVQRGELHIPNDALARHAYHQIRIEDGACGLQLESCVYGPSPYAEGVSRIIAAVRSRDLEHRLHGSKLDEQGAHPVQAQHRLLILRLGRNGAHPRQLRSCADCSGVRRIGHVRLYERPDKLGMQQHHLVPERLDLAGPPTRATACLKRHPACRPLCQKRD
jgi:4-hydroxy-tetrahydrodipicolinate reductase